MRLLHAIRSLRPETGGLVEAVKNLVPELNALGHGNEVVSLDPADATRPEATRVLGRASHGWGRAPEYARWLRTHAREFDAVIVHGLWQQQSFGAWQALRGTGTPYFVFPHGMLDPWFKRRYPLKHLKKWLYWPWADYRVLRDAAGVCFTADEERRLARESFWLYRARELITPLGIAEPPRDAGAQRAALAAAHPELNAGRYLLFLGRVHPKKGVEELMSAYATVYGGRSDAPLLAIAGPFVDDAYRRSLEALAARLGIAPAVRWLGMVKGDLKWGVMRGCEAFVLMSHQENFGLAVVEALACGRPVLISKPINIWREIATDGAGWAVRDDEAGAAEVLRRWAGLPAETKQAMGEAAERCYRTRFAARTAAANLANALEGALRQPPPLATPRSPLPEIAGEAPA